MGQYDIFISHASEDKGGCADTVQTCDSLCCGLH